MKVREILMEGVNWVLQSDSKQAEVFAQLSDENFLQQYIKLMKNSYFDYEMLPDFGDTEEHLDAPDAGEDDALRALMISNLIFLDGQKNVILDCPRQEDEGHFGDFPCLTTPYLVEVYYNNVINRDMFKLLKKAKTAPYSEAPAL